VRSTSDEAGRNELDVHECPATAQYVNSSRSPDIENQYVNSVALEAEKNERSCTTDVDGDKSQALYQDLNTGAGSAEPIVYEVIKPRVLPKPARGADKNA